MCFLTRSFSDPQPLELLKGSAACQGHVAPAAVIDRLIAGQPALALFLAVERHRIGPLRLERLLLRRSLRLDESLCLAVRLGPVSPAAFGFKSQHRAVLPPLPGAVSAAVVTQDAAAGDALAVEPRHSPHQKAHRCGLLLIMQHLDVGQSRGVIYGDVGFLVARTG
jgi:hypothetical protein